MNTYKFKNGAEVKGTPEQILAFAKIMGETVDLAKLGGPLPIGYYLSSNGDLVELSAMAVPHIKNALLKIARGYFETKNFEKLDDSEFVTKYTAFGDLPQVVELFKELISRIKK